MLPIQCDVGVFFLFPLPERCSMCNVRNCNLLTFRFLSFFPFFIFGSVL
jgi:hypothetical protein